MHLHPLTKKTDILRASWKKKKNALRNILALPTWKCEVSADEKTTVS